MVYNYRMANPYTSDTSIDAEEVQLNLWRAMSGEERIQKMAALSSRLRDMAFDAIRRRHPEFSEQQIRLKFIELTYGKDLATKVEQYIDAA